MGKENNIKRIPNEIFFEQIKDILSQGQSVKINVTGRSMDPTFKDGKDVLVISPFDPEKLAVGDVVLFDRGDTICVHRIIARKGERLVIRGDGNPKHALEPCKVSDVIGIVTGGTFRGGKPFSITDEAWARQTAFVKKYYPMLCAWHKLRIILLKYPLSILVLLLLLYLSFADPSTFENVNESMKISDKLVHAIMYAGLSSVFWFEWIKGHGLRRRAYLRGILPCVVFPMILGGLIELGQTYLTGGARQGDWFDLLANICGSFVATVGMVLVAAPLFKKFRNRKNK